MQKLLVLLSAVSIQLYANATSENANDGKDVKINDKLLKLADVVIDSQDGLTPEIREKRFYDIIGFTGASSFSSFVPNAPNYGDGGPRNTVGGDQNRLSEIIKNLQNIADITRRQNLPPSNPPNILPAFYPYPFIPISNCGCGTQSNAGNRPQTTASPPTPTTSSSQETTASLGNRSGVSDNTDDDDGVRPISFDTIAPKNPQSVPVPPVEHGSFQAGAEPSPIPTSPPVVFSVQRYPANDVTPSVCDGAILACCHKPVVEASCFASEGCDDLPYDNPCIPNVLSKIVRKFKDLYQQRRG